MKEHTKNIEYDSVVTSVINQFQNRAEIGFEKYGTNLDRQDLSLMDWLNHAQQELMDGVLYFEKIKQIIEEGKRTYYVGDIVYNTLNQRGVVFDISTEILHVKFEGIDFDYIAEVSIDGYSKTNKHDLKDNTYVRLPVN